MSEETVSVTPAKGSTRSRLPLWLWWLAAAALLAASATLLDLQLTVFLQRHVSPGVDLAFQWVGRLGESGMYVAGALLVYAFSLWAAARGRLWPWGGGYAGLARASLFLLATMTAGGLVTLLLKKVVARARPEEFFEHGFYGLGLPFSGKPFDSFPSSHALTAFAVAAVVGTLRPAWRGPAIAAAALVALSRMVNLDHFLSDVLASALIAYSAAHWLAPRILNERAKWPLRPPWRWFKRT